MILPTTTVDGVIHLLGRTFKSRKAAEQYEREFIERVERQAGRRLSVRELTLGLQHVEDRSPLDQTRDKVWYQTTGKPKPHAKPEWTGHPMDNPANQVASDRFGTRETYAALSQKAKEAFDRRTAQEKPPADAERRAKARANAFDLWAAVAFDPNTPASLVEGANRLKHAAEFLDVDTYRDMAAEYVAQVRQHQQVRTAKIDVERARAVANLPTFEAEEFEPAPPAKKPAEPYPDWASTEDPEQRAAQLRENRRALGLPVESAE